MMQMQNLPGELIKNWLLALSKPLFFSIFLLSLISMHIAVSGQTTGQFAQLVSVTHACGTGGTGSVEFEIIGNPDFFNYYWLHGSQELSLSGLSPGIYTLIVENIWSCWEEYVIEILTTGNCELSYELIDPNRRCQKLINITVTSDSIPLQEQALDIVWSDGDNSGLTRTVSTAIEADYCVTISVTDSSGTCCILNQCIHINKDSYCSYDGPVIVVNEYNRNKEGKEQYLELLVAGEGECGDTFDLRGYHIDDNNGYLIPANSFVNSFNLEKIGVDLGYLTFSQAESWASVPTGSLIIIYSENGTKHDSIPADDPADNNQDGVYVLAANNDAYLSAKSGKWNQAEKEMEYTGSYTTPKWDLLELNEKADGIQIRQPTSEFEHGVSLGLTGFSAKNNFPLWITSYSYSSYHCQFVLSDPMNKLDFTCTDGQDGSHTPGTANSQENAALINFLKTCSDTIQSFTNLDSRSKNSFGKTIPSKEDKLKIFPNPFQSIFTLDINSNVSGLGLLTIYSVSGQLVFSQKYSCTKGNNRFEIQPVLASGIYHVRFEFPSSQIKYTRLAKTNL